jgi:hypothetical protein
MNSRTGASKSGLIKTDAIHAYEIILLYTYYIRYGTVWYRSFTTFTNKLYYRTSSVRYNEQRRKEAFSLLGETVWFRPVLWIRNDLVRIRILPFEPTK